MNLSDPYVARICLALALLLAGSVVVIGAELVRQSRAAQRRGPSTIDVAGMRPQDQDEQERQK